MAAAVKIDNLSVKLGGKFQALKDVSVEFEAGRTIGVIGPSGAGKTTLIRCIVGRLRTEPGQVMVFGEPAGSSGLRTQLSYMTQELSIYPDLTVNENLRYFAVMRGQSRRQALATVAEVLKAVDMADKSGSLAGDLSGGQKQRLSLAVALIGEPKLMVLDEPTVGLDPVLRESLWRLFSKLASQGTTIIISSHSMDEAERCDDLALIRDGRLIAHDTPAGLRQKTGAKTIEDSFLKLVGSRQ